jgi:hypothetical protein
VHILPGLTSSSMDLALLESVYQATMRKVFVFLLVASGLAFLTSFGIEHKNVRRVEQEQKNADGTQA